MEHAPKPRVSVICPTYNRSRPILDTLASVTAQTVTDWEMLVVSDGSTDDTDDWVRHSTRTDPRIRLLRTERHGHPSGPRNIALAEARGEVVAYLDHDDQWRADHLEVVLSLTDRGADIVATGFELRDPAGALTAASQPYEMCWHPEFQVLGVVFEPSRVAHRRGLAERAGGWRTGAGLEDWDLWLRMTDAGARFTTVADRTTVLLDDTGTRRHRIPARHRLPLAVFDDPRAARAMLELLRSGRDDAAHRAAQLADSEEWLARLVADEYFVRPVGWDGDPAADIARARRSAQELWPDLLVLRQHDRYALAQPLRCATAEHAERVTSLVRRTQPRLFTLLDAVAAECAGTLAGAGRR
ncbi:glycosyltransferase [Streptomyces sp. SID5910]|uniref:glycosyltransferase family 2 protein n=1 Tax=Streptomyces sp. SID5910 TaxID=2690312 RepID=UPI001369B1B2|nr:glycosyltransferase [Streptomyces sp. SID5910]MYR46553.1 glycosyltransferase [Streptomyces sp. SID5910]